MTQENETISQRQAEIVGDALLAAPSDSQRAAREEIERQRAMKPAMARIPALIRAVASLFGFRSG